MNSFNLASHQRSTSWSSHEALFLIICQIETILKDNNRQVGQDVNRTRYYTVGCIINWDGLLGSQFEGMVNPPLPMLPEPVHSTISGLKKKRDCIVAQLAKQLFAMAAFPGSRTNHSTPNSVSGSCAWEGSQRCPKFLGPSHLHEGPRWSPWLLASHRFLPTGYGHLESEPAIRDIFFHSAFQMK